MDAETCEAVLPVFDGKRDLALYPDEQMFLIPKGQLLLWGQLFDVHEPRPYKVGAVKAAAAAALGMSLAALEGRWEDHLLKLAGKKNRIEEQADERHMSWRGPPQLNPSRTEAIVAMRGNGMTLEAIGAVFDLSKGRVGQILAKAERIEKWRQAREAAAEEHRLLCAKLDEYAAHQARRRRARNVVRISGVEPATNWRTPQDEYLAILTERV